MDKNSLTLQFNGNLTMDGKKLTIEMNRWQIVDLQVTASPGSRSIKKSDISFHSKLTQFNRSPDVESWAPEIAPPNCIFHRICMNYKSRDFADTKGHYFLPMSGLNRLRQLNAFHPQNLFKF